MEVSGVVECGWWEEEKGWDIWVVSDWGVLVMDEVLYEVLYGGMDVWLEWM